MDPKTLRTKKWQRVGILFIAILMLISTVMIYLMIVVTGQRGSDDADSQLAKLQSQVSAKQVAVETAAKTLSGQYFDDFVQYKSEVKSFNAATVNEGDVVTRDLKVGDGAELAEGNTDYLAYYIGFCPNESIFDSSFDSADNPTSLKVPIQGEGLIEGWNSGVVGMKLGGVREVAIPSDLAYGEREMCDMTNAPLKFIIMAIPNEGEIKTAYEEFNDAYAQLMAAYGQ